MKYVARILEEGETVTHSAVVHWVIYLPALTFLGITLAVMAASPVEPLTSVIAFVGICFALVSWLFAFIRRRTTELAVTTKRVIVKTGLIKRNTSELNRDRIEGVSVNQSVLGRILGYGTITVQGTGGGIAPIKMVDNPLKFRQAVGTG